MSAQDLQSDLLGDRVVTGADGVEVSHPEPHLTVTEVRRVPGGHGVVVGVDTTQHAMRALRWATEEAAVRHLPLTICHVHDRTGDDVVGPECAGPGGGVGFGERADLDPVGLLAQATDLASQWRPDLGVIRATTRTGPVAAGLRAQADGADVLVVGSRGRGRVAGLLLGSTGIAASDRPPCPTIVVRASRSQHGRFSRRVLQPGVSGHRGPFAGHVVVGINGSPAAAAGLRFGLAAAGRYGVPLVAVHACPLGPADSYRDMDWYELHMEHRSPGWDLLERVVEAVPAEHRSVRVKLALHEGPPAAGLSRASAGARLLVLGSGGHGRLSGAVRGSVSQAMIGRAVCPVAVVPPAVAVQTPPMAREPST